MRKNFTLLIVLCWISVSLLYARTKEEGFVLVAANEQARAILDYADEIASISNAPVTQAAEEDNSIQELDVIVVHDMDIAVQWVTSAPKAEIRLQDSNGTQVASEIVNATQGFITAPDWGKYTVQVQAMDQQEQYVSETAELEVEVVDNRIHDLKVEMNGNEMTASWKCAAPYMHIVLYAEDGVTALVQGITHYQSVYIELEVGTYTLWLRPLDAAQEYYVSEMVEAEITVSNPETAVEDVQSGTMLYLYDMMGRLIDSKHSSDERPWKVPQGGAFKVVGYEVMR